MTGKQKRMFVGFFKLCLLKPQILWLWYLSHFATESSFLYIISVGILLPREVFCFVWGNFCPDDNAGSCQTSTWTSPLHSCSPTFLQRNTESIPPLHRQREWALCQEQQKSLASLVANTCSYNHPKEKTCWWQVFSFLCCFHGEEHCFLPEFWFPTNYGGFFSSFFCCFLKKASPYKGCWAAVEPGWWWEDGILLFLLLQS